MKEKRNKREIFFQINLDICKSTTPVWEEKIPRDKAKLRLAQRETTVCVQFFGM